MKIENYEIFFKAKKILEELYGENSDFRDGQYEAIESVVLKRRTLVVQKTGWGKSLVYFVATKILRELGSGVTIVVSPLLALMDNQFDAANKLKINCKLINSKTKDEIESILNDVINNKVDLLLITPESLHKVLVKVLNNISIGCLVIDEAHCISDWGHDFRLEYGKINKLLPMLPNNIPILATTATANNRVIDDLKLQLGDLVVSRGNLTRDNIAIQVLKIKDRVAKYAWLADNLNKFPGTGIIYCLTQNDCVYVSDFLNSIGINALPYYSSNDQENNDEALEKFNNNQIKAIVATVKLGMGYDKSDVSFVIHFNQPANIVSYYQQVGRAGRNIDKSYAVMLVSNEDLVIGEHFIKNSFPSEEDMNEILYLLENSNGLRMFELQEKVNKAKSKIEKTLMFLINQEVVIKEGTIYYRTVNKFEYNHEYYNSKYDLKRKELYELNDITETSTCYSNFIVNSLDDITHEKCNICSNCIGKDILDFEISKEKIDYSLNYLKNVLIKIEPRKLDRDRRKIIEPLETGICLSRYGETGYGQMVKEDKYISKIFRDELLEKSVEVLTKFIIENNIKHITNVSSLRSNIVKDFTLKLATRLNIEYIECLNKKDAKMQKEMENSYYQATNAIESFSIIENIKVPEIILLVDDIFDSRWTFTVCGSILKENGAKNVYPFALATSSKGA